MGLRLGGQNKLIIVPAGLIFMLHRGASYTACGLPDAATIKVRH